VCGETDWPWAQRKGARRKFNAENPFARTDFAVMLRASSMQAVRLRVINFALHFSIMAVTKVSSTVHFIARGSAVSGRHDSANGRWIPNTDVYATETGIVIKVELPGMKSENLEITVEGNRIRIAGTRPDCCREPKCSFLVMEISYGPFESILELPGGYDLSQAKAVYVNGFLRIDVPKANPSHSKTTKVPISEGN
jgi:HSP20 family protein